MELYKGKNWDVIFGDWCQEFVGRKMDYKSVK